MNGLEIEPMEPFGAVIRGFNLDTVSDKAQVAHVKALLEKHLVLVFRGHNSPTNEALINFAGAFGPLQTGTEWLEGLLEYPEILPVSNMRDKDGIPIGTGGHAALPWHSDYSYADWVGKESFLEAVTLPQRAPSTKFVDQYAALKALPATLVQKVRELRAFHAIGPEYTSGGTDKDSPLADYNLKVERGKKTGAELTPIPTAVYPLVVTHPETGRETLYAGPGDTHYILDLDREESNAILSELFVHTERPENIYAHEWQTGDLVMFDTLGTLHCRDAFESDQPRYMRQLSTICQIK